MKKFRHICLSVLLSLTVLFIGSGVDIMRCTHTGTVKVMTMLNRSGMGKMTCGMNADCMTVEHVELSPKIFSQAPTYYFHIFQPLLAILPSLVTECLVPVEHKATEQFIHVAWKSPPRDYLNFIQILLI